MARAHNQEILLGRALNSNTLCWEGEEKCQIPDELIYFTFCAPKVSAIDLLFLLIKKDKIIMSSKVSTNPDSASKSPKNG